jgi:hypothetical protein
MTSNNYLWCFMKNYVQTLLLIIGISTGFADSSKAMDPKEDLWQDMIQVAESRARYNQIIHNIYTDWQKKEKSLTPDLKEHINNFTQQLTNVDYEYLMDMQGVLDKKTRDIFLSKMLTPSLQKLLLDSLKNKIGWEFFEHSLRAFKTPQERMAICPRLVEELEFLRAENLGSLNSKIESSDGLEQDELNYTVVLLERLKRYSEQAPLRDDGFGMRLRNGFTQRDFFEADTEKLIVSMVKNKEKPNVSILPERIQKMEDTHGFATATVETENALMPIDLPTADAEEIIASMVENNEKLTFGILPERAQKLEDKRGFATVTCNFINKNMNPIRDQFYVDHVLEFLSHYVIQPDTDHLKANFPRAENIKRPALDLSEFLPPEFRKAKKKKPVAAKKASKKKPPPAKTPQKEKTLKAPMASAQALPLPLPPAKESTKAIPVANKPAIENKPELVLPKILPQPAALPQKEVVISVKEGHPLKQELRMAFTDAYELEGYLAIFESQSRRARVNFEDLAKGKESFKDKKSAGLSWYNFEKFLQDKDWIVDESLSKGSSVSFIPPRRFSLLTGLTPKRINVHRPKDTKILLYEAYLKFFRSGFESMGFTEKSISDWIKVF